MRHLEAIVKLSRFVLAALMLWPTLSVGQSFQPLKNATSANVGSPYLLTDGTILIQNNFTTGWVKLTPDQFGSYVNGTWSTVASLPAGYSPFYYAAGVLADGRLVIIGGEDNYAGNATYSDTNLGAVYDPKSNTWMPIAPPLWANVGDAPSVVLPNGQFLLGMAFNTQLALLDPVTLTWTAASNTGKATSNNEEGFTLLPDGSVLDVNVSGSGIAQRYLPATGQWISAGSTPQPLQSAGEMGPAVLRPNGTVFAMGASGANAVYTPPTTLTGTGSWAAGPSLAVGDAPACLLPDGNVLVEGGSGFYEFDGTNLNQVTTASQAADAGRLLLLPNGQVLFTAGAAQIYTPASGTPNPAWAPTITSFPATIGPGATYAISGTQFNGLSQAVAYGDDYQAATNYPLVRITNQVTGHVFYARTHDHSTMAVATGSSIVSTNFDVPAGIELGASTLVVVANGIPSAPVSVTVGTLQASTTALVSSLNPSAGGQGVTYTATVTGSGGTPTSTVTFLNGVTRIGTGTLNGSGVATLTTSSLIVGAHSITATYGGDTNFTSSTSTAVAQTVTGAPSTVVLTSTLNPSGANVAITLTATVAGSGGTPTGTVSFFDGTYWLASSTLTNGAATFSTSALPIGSHSITVQYSGDTTFASGTSNTVTQFVTGTKPSATALTSLLNPSVKGQAVGFTATVTSTTGGTPTGIVTFFDGSASLGTATLNASGMANFVANALAVASHSITAQYGGDTNYASSTSSALTQVVNAIPSAAALTSSLNPSVSGQGVTFTATVTIPSGGTPTGIVTFLDGTASLGTGTLNASGVATFTTSTLAAASHSISAYYGGDINFASNTSSAITQVVNLSPSATTLTSSVNPATSGEAVTFTAAVTGTAGGTPTGIVTFLEGTTSLGTGTLNASGVATFTTSTLAATSHSISAHYGGDANFASGTSSTITQVVNFNLSTTALTSSTNSPINGQAVTFNAAVTNAGGTVPTGSVLFKDGLSTLATGTLDGTGKASYTTNSLAVGSHSVSAAYSGDTSNTASTSSTVAVTVEDFSLPSSVPPISITPGTPNTATFSVTPEDGFLGTISFTCTTPSNMNESSCSATSVQITGPSAVASTLTVNTTASHQTASISHQIPRLGSTIAGTVLAGCIWLGIPAFKRRRLGSSIFFLLLLGFMGTVGCGGGAGGGSGSQTDPGTPAGPYTLVLTGTSGTSSHSINVSVTVQ
jgi:hypothetical protein